MHHLCHLFTSRCQWMLYQYLIGKLGRTLFDHDWYPLVDVTTCSIKVRGCGINVIDVRCEKWQADASSRQGSVHASISSTDLMCRTPDDFTLEDSPAGLVSLEAFPPPNSGHVTPPSSDCQQNNSQSASDPGMSSLHSSESPWMNSQLKKKTTSYFMKPTCDKKRTFAKVVMGGLDAHKLWLWDYTHTIWDWHMVCKQVATGWLHTHKLGLKDYMYINWDWRTTCTKSGTGRLYAHKLGLVDSICSQIETGRLSIWGRQIICTQVKVTCTEVGIRGLHA